MKRLFFFLPAIPLLSFFISFRKGEQQAWIRINLMGYKPASPKVAVWCAKEAVAIKTFQLVDAATGIVVFTGNAGNPFGAYGPFVQTYRLNFSSFRKAGTYKIKAGETESPAFNIRDDVYKGAADFCLRYMRQQRCGFNPYLKDSCHTHGCYSLYGAKAGLPDSTHLNISGGWHDASDYLQYSATSANATYHLLMAYRDFPQAFGDQKLANGLDGKNGIADVLDEAKWGLDWLLKMHPKEDWMFNQVADDRDHQGMRIPKEDSFYGKGFERPAYFVSGEPQQRGKFMNATTGMSSTAAKFASAFALGADVFHNDKQYSDSLFEKSFSALELSLIKRGFTQTTSIKSPYIYAEEDWKDDFELELAALSLSAMKKFDEEEKKHPSLTTPIWPSLLRLVTESLSDATVTPWLGADTANHYQWYPFINIGHYELGRFYKKLKLSDSNFLIPDKKSAIEQIKFYYKTGIERVWAKAKSNAFYRGIPFIWCSNNLTTSFAIQCYWYRQLTRDKSFEEFEQANIDWLFGCNPWGTSMVYGLPSNGDTPTDPHSAFTHLKQYPIDGGLVDGPVYTSIYKSLIGIKLYEPDEYETFQSGLAVYHDDYGDYSTNEPTMDGTASLIYLLATTSPQPSPAKREGGPHSVR